MVVVWNQALGPQGLDALPHESVRKRSSPPPRTSVRKGVERISDRLAAQVYSRSIHSKCIQPFAGKQEHNNTTRGACLLTSASIPPCTRFNYRFTYQADVQVVPLKGRGTPNADEASQTTPVIPDLHVHRHTRNIGEVALRNRSSPSGIAWRGPS